MSLDQIAGAITPFIGYVVGASITGSVALAVARNSRKAEDRRLRILLFNDESKRAIEKLYELVNTKMEIKEPEQWRWRIFQYLQSFEARAYLPRDLRVWAERELDQNYWNQLAQTWPYST